MTTIDALHPIVTAGQGDLIRLGGIGVQYKIPSESTHGAFSIVEHPIEPGTLVPPHTHTREDEFSFVVEGEVGVRIGDHVFTSKPGDYVVKPRNVPHTFWNAGPGLARIVEIISPPRFDHYFRELAKLFTAGGRPEMDQIAALGARYGLTFHMDWVPELNSAYGLTLLGFGRG